MPAIAETAAGALARDEQQFRGKQGGGDPTRLFIPTAYCDALVNLVRPWQVTPQMLLGDKAARRMRQSGGRLVGSAGCAAAVIERARALTGEPALGILLGLRASPSFFRCWSVGTGAPSTHFRAESLFDALTLQFQASGTSVVLTAQECVSFGASRDVVLFAAVVGLWQACRVMFGTNVHASLTFAMPRPFYFERFAHVLPTARFRQPSSTLRLTHPRAESVVVRPNERRATADENRIPDRDRSAPLRGVKRQLYLAELPPHEPL